MRQSDEDDDASDEESNSDEKNQGKERNSDSEERGQANYLTRSDSGLTSFFI
jgi:hypothetical protein